MEYGLLGEKLSHSCSPLVHKLLCNCEYALLELPRDKIGDFLEARAFRGINVTIPYKKLVMPYLDEISTIAKRTGVVNTILNRDGRLYGYNTDYTGFLENLAANDISLLDKHVCILGSGGTASTVQVACKDKQAAEVCVITHTMLKTGLQAETLQSIARCEVLINTSPCGMSPNTKDAPIGISLFEKLEAYVDVIYNPLCTTMMRSAKKQGVKAINGLRMLVAQAKASQELFRDEPLPDSLVDDVCTMVFRDMLNIVLVGMPACGKSTIGKLMAFEEGIRLVDIDELICAKSGKTVTQLFKDIGEPEFRAMESAAVESLEDRHGLLISTGGGCVMSQENYESLKRNGIIIYIKRDLDKMILSGETRPLAHSAEDLAVLYDRRRAIYALRSDITVENNTTPEACVDEICEKLDQFIGLKRNDR